MGCNDFCALCKAFGAENAEDKSLFAVFIIYLIACFIRSCGVEGHEAFFLGKSLCEGNCLTLGFASVKKFRIADAEIIGKSYFLVGAGI